MAPTPGPIPGSVGPLELQEAPYVMTSPRKSMSVSTKGLLNMPGQNNCFLNSAVQVLWHLDIFRRSFRELASHACMAESCIFCALKELFTQFQYSQESALPPDALRHALAKTFCDQRRFQLGFMDDAAECFENILLRIHVHIANQESDDMCGNAQCIPHQKFAMTLVEQRVCHNCGSTTEPLPFTQMVHYVTTSALCAKSQESKEQDFRTQTSFGTLLRLAGDMGEVRDCQSGCGSKIHVKKTLMNHPEVVSVGLVWDSECPTLQHITDVFYSIGMYLRLPDMFNAVYDMERASCTMHQLVGVVTYYGKHYSTFFFHTKLRVWIYFDDATVREVGPSWEQVVEKCQRGRFQPLLLLFANPKGSASLPQPSMQDCNASYTTDPSGKSARAANQRQAVIRQYLMLQNSHPNFTSKNRYSGIISSPHAYPYSYDNQAKHMDHKFHNYEQTFQEKVNQPPPVYSNLQSTSAPVYSNLQSTAAPVYSNLQSTAPVYSNLQQLNSHILQYQQDRTSLSKLNEISLATPQVENPDVYNAATKSYDMSKDSDSAFTEEDPESNDMYISRKQVESVLNLQKRQMSLCRSYSQSSVGNRNSSSSLESFDNHHIVAKAGVVKNQQVENLANRRDSGTWSNDRNSSSSNNSVENPFLTVVSSKRLLLGLNGLPKGPPSDHTSDHGYDSFSVSSSDSYPSINGSPVKLDPRLTQIPEDWLPEESTDLDKQLKLVTEDTSGPPDCDKLCAEADLLLAKSHEKEKDGDLVMAALLCDSAAARARQAMEAPYNNSRSLVSAKMKHSTCVMRSSCLYRRLKDHEMDERRKQKGHHSRQGSRDSTHSRHSRQGSKDSTHSKSGSNKDGNNQSDEAENFGKNIEIYGTLPKKSRKKVSGTTSVATTKAKDDQVYKDFLDKQRKNTSLSDALSETLQKNVEVPQNKSENVTKSKLPVTSDKHHRKGSGDGIPPKSPNRRKSDSPVKGDPEVRKKSQKPLPVEQAYVGLFPSSDYNDLGRDLLSPMSSPDKKQHKIKRKLMGGFMKRKNRSMPDLREDQDISDPLDRSFDDAIIPATMTLPNGKLKKLDNPADSGLGNMSRGFHQPHHAFVKKDLNQRPLLTKVNPPSVLPSPKIKLIHSLPSLPKKPVELSPNGIAKPSKIPFISTLPKHETAALPPLQSPKLTDIKPLPKPSILKTSAIPVLTPQVPLSMLKSNSIKEEALRPQQTSEQTIDKEDLPQPTNPFLSEIQAKRKQVLLKSQQKKESLVEDQHESLTTINRDTTSMLPKLALQGEGTLWLKELQSKQKQLLNKNDDLAVGLPRTVNSHEKIKAVQSLSFSNHKEPEKIMVSKAVTVNHRNTKISTQTDSERTSSQMTTTNNKTPNSVKDLASRFEKVMIIKPKDTTESVNANVSSQDVESIKPPATLNQKLNANSNKEVPNQTVISPIQDKEVVPHINVPQLNTYPLKSALKTKSESINVVDSLPQEQSNSALAGSPRPNGCALEAIAVPKPIVGFKQPGLDNNINSSSAVSKLIKPALKQSGLDCTDSSSGLSKPEMDTAAASGSLAGVSKPIKPALKQASVDSTFSQRPMQPPDYATAMQRIELIRTSNGDGQQLKQPNFEYQVASSGDSSPRKKQGAKKKSVTFSDEVVLVACAEYDEIDFSSNPLFERVYQQHMESGKGEIPNLPPLQEHDNGYGSVPASETRSDDTADNQTNSNTPSSCNLCHNKYVIPPSTYCTDCEFYLSRYKA